MISPFPSVQAGNLHRVPHRHPDTRASVLAAMSFRNSARARISTRKNFVRFLWQIVVLQNVPTDPSCFSCRAPPSRPAATCRAAGVHHHPGDLAPSSFIRCVATRCSPSESPAFGLISTAQQIVGTRPVGTGVLHLPSIQTQNNAE